MNEIPVVLLLSANDDDAYLHELRREREGIDEALLDLRQQNKIRLEKKIQTSADSLVDVLTSFSNSAIVLHYSGHASGTHLQLEGWTTSESVRSQGVAGLLGTMPKLKLVFLNGCATQGQVDLLLNSGIGAVIATDVAINDSVAANFAIVLYKNLAQNEPLETAFNRAKSAIGLFETVDEVPQSKGLKFKRRKGRSNFAWGLYYRDETILTWTLQANDKKEMVKQIRALLAAAEFSNALKLLTKLFDGYKRFEDKYYDVTFKGQYAGIIRDKRNFTSSEELLLRRESMLREAIKSVLKEVEEDLEDPLFP